MAQTDDFDFANQSGLLFRQQVNAVVAALVSSNSGSTAPDPTFPGMVWLDTSVTPALLKIRNAANDAWISVSLGVTATTAELNQLDGNTFTADILPNADSTLDLGSSTAAWAEAHIDTVISTNTSDGTLSIPTTYVTNGSAKVWVNFNGTGTIAVRDSFNVSSLTDNGTGDYTVNFTNSFGAADYGFSGGGYSDLSSFTQEIAVGGPSAVQVNSIRLWCNATDLLVASFSLHGDLA